jgi:hypothetical protein
LTFSDFLARLVTKKTIGISKRREQNNLQNEEKRKAMSGKNSWNKKILLCLKFEVCELASWCAGSA